MEKPGLSIAAALVFAGALAAAASCTLQLEPVLSCGDGLVDASVGEECDPLDVNSYINACSGTSRPQGEADCDPDTCQLINDRAQCATCGDGFVDEVLGEECDDDNLNGRACPGGVGQLQCTDDCKLDFSACDKCGNGTRDAGEECDFNESGGFVNPRSCSGNEDMAPLPSPFNTLPYTFGETIRCNDDCRFDRLSCSYCGNDRLEAEPVLVDAARDQRSLPEVCDGDLFDPERLAESRLGPFCESQGDNLRPNVECDSDCLGFSESKHGPACCLPSGEPCPSPTDQFRCCFEYADSDTTAGDACQVVINKDGENALVCR